MNQNQNLICHVLWNTYNIFDQTRKYKLVNFFRYFFQASFFDCLFQNNINFNKTIKIKTAAENLNK